MCSKDTEQPPAPGDQGSGLHATHAGLTQHRNCRRLQKDRALFDIFNDRSLAANGGDILVSTKVFQERTFVPMVGKDPQGVVLDNLKHALVRGQDGNRRVHDFLEKRLESAFANLFAAQLLHSRKIRLAQFSFQGPAGLTQPQVRVDACKQFAGAERVNQTIVCAIFERFNARFFTSPGKKQNYGQGTGLRLRAQPFHEPVSIQARHHDTAQDQVGLLLACCLERCFAIRRRNHVILLRKQAAEIVAHTGIVDSHQYPARSRVMAIHRFPRKSPSETPAATLAEDQGECAARIRASGAAFRCRQKKCAPGRRRDWRMP